MRITKFTHACVRLEHDGGVLVVDPGVYSEPAALAGADAVLVTHEHVDHVDVLRLAGAVVPVFVPAGARIAGLDAARGLEPTPVEVGAEFTAAGFTVRAVGGRHAFVHGGQPVCANVGYLVGGAGAGWLYHPGDALHVPAEEVETLLVPANAPWLKLTEAIDFVNAVRPARAFPVHDAAVNALGVRLTDRWLGQATDTDFRYWSPGESVD